MLVIIYNMKECIEKEKKNEGGGKGGLEYTVDEWKYPHYGQL